MYQVFRQRISVAARNTSWFHAWDAVEKAMAALNADLQHAHTHGFVHLSKDKPVVVKNPVIKRTELQFLRDIGQFNGCTGAIDGQFEDRYHMIALYVEFEPS